MDTRKLMPLLVFLIIWLGLTGIKSDLVYIFFAILTSVLVYYFAHQLSLLPKKPNIDLLKSIKYVFWLIAEIIKSSISVSKIAWRRNISIYPLLEPIISVQNTELGVVIYANSITLTPGTVTLSTEDNKLLVHALDIKFMRDLQDGTMDRKIEEIIIK
ncbi:MAG: Na+/H+ antiporter subunit E [Rickettsiaceae bacterium]|nr:Na+/H+ antiporter subunit E [Rickettsiaceae bacterium]UCM93504.1 MAG: Na+/H+ antiporter subunit E [Candidatus Megaira endosymbiont of Mesostigma viride]HJK88299.1 Na+/H+ antiporter subunit E [Candidatus Megaira endosymbiont of Mesostigma viride]